MPAEARSKNLVLPKVDPDHWLGGPPENPIRFSVIYRKGVYEVWDLSCKDAQRFDKIASKRAALKRVSIWARQSVSLEE